MTSLLVGRKVLPVELNIRVIRHRVGIKAPISEIYAALHKPEKLTGWWSTGAIGSGEVGSQIELTFPGYAKHVWRVEELTINQRVRLKYISRLGLWRDSSLVFELHAGPTQIFVMLTHTPASEVSEEDLQYFWTKWPTNLVSLKEFLETGKGRPFPNDIKIQHD